MARNFHRRALIEDDAKLLIEAATQKASDNSEAHSILQDAVKMLVPSHSISLHFTRRDCMCLFVALTRRSCLRISHQVAHDKDPSTNCTHLFIILLKGNFYKCY